MLDEKSIIQCFGQLFAGKLDVFAGDRNHFLGDFLVDFIMRSYSHFLIVVGLTARVDGLVS